MGTIQFSLFVKYATRLQAIRALDTIGAFMDKTAILQNTIQEYAWGSLTAIPQLLRKANAENIPQAELWMGAHPKAPSKVAHNNQWVSLLELIDENPVAILGKATTQKFNSTLPYLFKVLAAARPLSI